GERRTSHQQERPLGQRRAGRAAPPRPPPRRNQPPHPRGGMETGGRLPAEEVHEKGRGGRWDGPHHASQGSRAQSTASSAAAPAGPQRSPVVPPSRRARKAATAVPAPIPASAAHGPMPVVAHTARRMEASSTLAAPSGTRPAKVAPRPPGR